MCGARIVLLTADGLGTNEIMRQTAKSKTCLWRWQERFMQTGVEGLLHDRTRPSRVPPALFTGARLEEIGQALTNDMKHDDGINYLDINTLDRGAGKRVKNRSSRRKLPVHPELVCCGLLAYVEERRRAGDERLFPALRPSVTGQ